MKISTTNTTIVQNTSIRCHECDYTAEYAAFGGDVTAAYADVAAHELLAAHPRKVRPEFEIWAAAQLARSAEAAKWNFSPSNVG